MKILAIILFITSFSCLAEKSNIPREPASDYIKEHLMNIKPWQEVIYEVKECKNEKKLSKFLSEESMWNTGKEVEEAYSELIENLVFSNSSCLLNAITMLETHKINQITLQYLINPLYNSEYEINKALKPYKEKYTKFFTIYEKLKNEKNR